MIPNSRQILLIHS